MRSGKKQLRVMGLKRQKEIPYKNWTNWKDSMSYSEISKLMILSFTQRRNKNGWGAQWTSHKNLWDLIRASKIIQK